MCITILIYVRKTSIDAIHVCQYQMTRASERKEKLAFFQWKPGKVD